MGYPYRLAEIMARKVKNRLLLLPCAGFGRRVGSPLIKEMLPIGLNSRPLIDFSLNVAIQYQFDVHLITRSEKRTLVEYAKQFLSGSSVRFTFQDIDPSKEWPDTLLKSVKYWHEENLVVLPDTQWTPLESVQEVADQLKVVDATYGTFEAADFKTWGFVSAGLSSLKICEKPQTPLSSDFKAWGLMAFRGNAGESILRAHLESTITHEIQTLPLSSLAINLKSFRDLTRG